MRTGGDGLSVRRVYLLLFRADGAGGVPRTVLNLANAMVDRHEVEVISLYRGRDQGPYPIDPRIEVSYLYDARGGGAAGPDSRRLRRARGAADVDPALARQDRTPSSVYPSRIDPTVSGLTDRLLADKLSSLEPGVLISTRPSLHAAAARLAPRRLLTVAQDHLNFETRTQPPDEMAFLREADHQLDCLTVLTEADARDYAAWVGPGGPAVVSIPNALSWPVAREPAPLSGRTVIAGGRLVQQKAFHRLIDAYAPVARAHPDWRLTIFGRGERQGDLEDQVGALGLQQQVLLPGYTDDFAAELHRASVYALTSIYEGFPMVLLEAMSQGLPMVGYACPRGPAEVIVDGRNGRLVEDGDQGAFTAALLELVADEQKRRRMGAAALDDARRYEMARIIPRWEDLFERLVRRRDDAT